MPSDLIGKAPPPFVSDAAVEAAIEAIAAIARSEISKIDLQTASIESVLTNALRVSDREATILIFALIDDLATNFLRMRLTGKVHSGVDETFFKGNGMLATTYNKIALLAGMEWIRHDTYKNLSLIRKIRNEFAHHVKYSSLLDSPIKEYINSMIAVEDRIIASQEEKYRPMAFSVR